MPSRSMAEALHHCLAPADPPKGRSSGSRRHHRSSRVRPSSPEAVRAPHHSRDHNDKPPSPPRNKNATAGQDPHTNNNAPSPRAEPPLILPLDPATLESDSQATQKFNSDYHRLIHWDADHTMPSSPTPSPRHLSHLERAAAAELQRLEARIAAYAPVFQRNLARERLTGFFGDAVDLAPIRDLDWKTVLRFSASWCGIVGKRNGGDYGEVLWDACCLVVRLRVQEIERERKEQGG
ncbi:MAG: hypothetical protein L6R36_000382 [Xanthoria steineri]|nr:MAG: hypothetical protein L6R36_000382 [Xanthoria steineri]